MFVVRLYPLLSAKAHKLGLRETKSSKTQEQPWLKERRLESFGRVAGETGGHRPCSAVNPPVSVLQDARPDPEHP